ncbi:MAG: amidase family protein [Candidatus Diapherotrites archaeon]|nr:amidase family protein [Candidatus Diapherotrites archaeon]
MKREETVNFFAEEAKKNFSKVAENAQKIIAEIQNSEKKKLNYIETFDGGSVLAQLKELEKWDENKKKKAKLFGVPITVKDCICVKGMESKAGSRILKGYKPLFDATVIEKARKEGAIIVAKTTQDEFGFGTFSTNTEKVPKNPFDNERSCGGSSGGAAGFTSHTKNFHIALGQSTGGSIACPASFCGATGITPTYGLVSRYGLIDYANSMDKIGSIGRNVDDAALLLETIAGKDEKDSTTLDAGFVVNEGAIRKVALVTDFFENCDEKVQKATMAKIKKLKEFFEIEEVSLPLNVKYALAAYYIIATGEASTNLAKLSGLRYGVQGNVEGKHFDEYFSEIRSANFTDEAKRRIILGTFARMSGYRDAYYLKAMKVRTKLINEFKKAFLKYDLLLNPTMPVVAPKFSEIEKLTPLQNYAMDLCTVPANLAGLPHISCNAGFVGGLPVGLMATAPHLKERNLVSFGKVMEIE